MAHLTQNLPRLPLLSTSLPEPFHPPPLSYLFRTSSQSYYLIRLTIWKYCYVRTLYYTKSCLRKKKKERNNLSPPLGLLPRSIAIKLSLSLSLCSDRFSTVIARVPRITSYTHSSLLHFIFVDAFNKAGELCYRKVQDRREDGD